jgi:hypothetical protein
MALLDQFLRYVLLLQCLSHSTSVNINPKYDPSAATPSQKHLPLARRQSTQKRYLPSSIGRRHSYGQGLRGLSRNSAIVSQGATKKDGRDSQRLSKRTNSRHLKGMGPIEAPTFQLSGTAISNFATSKRPIIPSSLLDESRIDSRTLFGSPPSPSISTESENLPATSSTTRTAIASKTDAGTGCTIVAQNGTAIQFEEGASMGTVAAIDSCTNGPPQDFPCYCLSSAPNQRVCPYCLYRDALGQTICGRRDTTIGIMHPNRTFVDCHCNVAVELVGTSFKVDVTSTCETINGQSTTDSTPVTPAPTDAISNTASPITSPPSLPPTTQPPILTPATQSPTFPPTTQPPSAKPTAAPITPQTTAGPTQISATYTPGNLTVWQYGMWLSTGLTARPIAYSGEFVQYDYAVQGSTYSPARFHGRPDGAAVFIDNRPGNSGGWVYVSNSETENGGVGALTFDRNGKVVDFRVVLSGTSWNCNVRVKKGRTDCHSRVLVLLGRIRSQRVTARARDREHHLLTQPFPRFYLKTIGRKNAVGNLDISGRGL